MARDGYLLGLDVGSSSVKASLLDIASNTVVASAFSPATELPISSPRPGWAEQDPQVWWKHATTAVAQLGRKPRVNLADVKAIGISYQMHGLVLVDKNMKVLRDAIIWCDGRAVEIGKKAFEAIGPRACLSSLLNSPGNFTASRLRWVKENEPRIYKSIYKMMLPGDYLAMRLTGTIATTPSGLSEGIFWDFRKHGVSDLLMSHYGINGELLPDQVPTFAVQGELTRAAAVQWGLKAGTPVSYRAGDQPNNAFSLNVLNDGEVAATAGTSGVVYAVFDRPLADAKSRVNTFVHVNYTRKSPRYGMLLCVNGTGILNSWMRRTLGNGSLLDYAGMNGLAASVPVGSDGISILPFGNGAERTLENRDIGAQIHGVNFNRHSPAHLLRAAQEGIVFALNNGFDIMKQAGVKPKTVRAGHANMFLSPLFCEAFATVTGTTVELFNTDGAQGAARGAGMGAGIYTGGKEAFAGLALVKRIRPSLKLKEAYKEAYARWCRIVRDTVFSSSRNGLSS